MSLKFVSLNLTDSQFIIAKRPLNNQHSIFYIT